jgi:hypothetical protein
LNKKTTDVDTRETLVVVEQRKIYVCVCVNAKTANIDTCETLVVVERRKIYVCVCVNAKTANIDTRDTLVVVALRKIYMYVEVLTADRRYMKAGKGERQGLVFAVCVRIVWPVEM